MSTDAMTDLATLHRRAVEGFVQRVDGLGGSDWTRPTPCSAWTVRELVNHVVVEELWTPPLMAGQSLESVGDAFDGDQLGQEPKQAVRDAATRAADAVAAAGALDRIVHLSFGDTPADEYVWQLTTDHLVHTWDLAHAVGGDEALDAELVDACGRWFADREDLYRAAGAIGPRPGAVADDAQSRLLAAFGRAG